MAPTLSLSHVASLLLVSRALAMALGWAGNEPGSGGLGTHQEAAAVPGNGSTGRGTHSS